MAKEVCEQCGGAGRLLVKTLEFDGDSDRQIIGQDGTTEPCDECEGTGWWDVEAKQDQTEG